MRKITTHAGIKERTCPISAILNSCDRRSEAIKFKLKLGLFYRCHRLTSCFSTQFVPWPPGCREVGPWSSPGPRESNAILNLKLERWHEQSRNSAAPRRYHPHYFLASKIALKWLRIGRIDNSFLRQGCIDSGNLRLQLRLQEPELRLRSQLQEVV